MNGKKAFIKENILQNQVWGDRKGINLKCIDNWWKRVIIIIYDNKIDNICKCNETGLF